ncbi:MAG: hydrogenase small subunit [Actinomycetota bacterium]|nr:hydrogenase small subunit [Actinomycetota bacterium]MDI6821859.1 hydrogenase small subunit [Actinomycetota bacterium]
MESIFKGLSRRDFLKYCASIAAMLGLSEIYVPQIAAALEEAAKGKPPVIWMQGQSCAGCTVSFINSREPTPAELVLDILSVRFHPNIMAAAGDVALNAIETTMEEAKGKYVYIFEGALPTAEEGRFCEIGETSAVDWVKKVAKDAHAVIAIGACASFGGIPAANRETTGASSVQDILGTPVVKIPGCPAHPDWVIGTVVKLLLFGKDAVLDGLDKYGRPKEFYGTLIHDNCPRRHWFEAGKFVEDFNDPEQANYCLLLKGCKGPFTYADCPKRKWNSGTNFCIDANAPCQGCTQPEFYAKFSPLYEKLPEIGIPGIAGYEVSADTIAKVLGIVTAAGIGLHLVGQIATGRLGKGGPPERGEK